MAQLINEAKRMQHLAGILNENKEEDTSAMEGLNLYLEILGYNPLFEAEEDKKGFLSNILSKLGQKGAAFFGALNGLYSQIDPKGQELVKNAIKYVADKKLTPDQIKKELNLVKEAEENDDFNSPILGPLKKWLKTKPGNIVKVTMAIIVGASLFTNTVINAASAFSPKTTKKAADATYLDRSIKSNHSDADKFNINVGGEDLTKVDSKPNTTVNILDFPSGNSKQLTPQGEENYQNYIKNLKKAAKENPKDSIEVDATGFVSNQGNKFSNKANDSKDPLDVARTKTITSKLKNDLKDFPNIKVSEKPNSPDAYKSFKVDPKATKQGAIVTTHIDKKDIPVEDPIKLLSQWAPEKADWNVDLRQDTEKAEEPTSTGATGSETLPKTEPSPSTPSSPQDIKATATEFSKLNRNGQIATVLSKINPGLDISKKLGQNKITSYTDANLTATQGDAKKLAALIMNIRKNPDALLKKVANATGIKLEPRAKAVTTKVTKGTQAQLQAIKESSLISLLREAMIDQISDEDIKKNQDMILALLGTMYASAGNTELSIVPKDSAQAQKLKDMGFAPQPGGNYVFLAPGQTKAQVQNFDTQADKIKTQPDITRVDKKSGAATTYKTALSRIKTPNDFADLIVKLIPLTNTQFQQDKTKVNSAFFSLRNRIKIQESVSDVDMVVDIIKKDSTFSSLLSNINTAEEFVQLILRDIVPDLPPALKQGENIKKVKSAIITAANNYKKQSTTQSPQNSEPAPAQHSSAYNKQQREKQASAASKK